MAISPDGVRFGGRRMIMGNGIRQATTNAITVMPLTQDAESDQGEAAVIDAHLGVACARLLALQVRQLSVIHPPLAGPMAGAMTTAMP